MVDGATTSKRPNTSRPLPAANHKAAGFAAFRTKSKPRGLTQSSREHNNRVISNSCPTSVSESRGMKRKLDNMEIVDIDEVRSDGSIVFSHSDLKEPRNMETHNRVSELVRLALVKSVEGEKQRLLLETSLRQQIRSLEGRLQQEKFDHNNSKRRIRDLERGLKAASANVERTNTLIQATSAQLLDADDEGDREKV
ncbi:hypothetical protein JB92DRAFT_585534 [Gautieria morchelliformis]|nr:hypothetical protein JB92DRAFT_585534 [Gautieria morchelliformis]